MLSDEFYEKDDNFSNKFRQAYSDIWKELKNEYDNKDNLPIELIHIISIYSHCGSGGSVHKDLNRLLSYSPEDDYILTFEKYLNYSLEKLPPYNGKKLLRRPDYFDELYINQQSKGYVWEVKKFLSCTYDMVWSGDLLYEIYTKKDNSKARVIEPYAFRRGEKEVLFMSNTVFEIIDIKIVEFDEQRIVLQEL